MSHRVLAILLACAYSLPFFHGAAAPSSEHDHGARAHASEIFSPAFFRQVERNVANLQVSSREVAEASAEEKIILWNPLSASLTSGCAGSACVGSGCGLSGCAGSGCGLSGCVGSGCGVSACGGSACTGSACGLSGCLGSACGLSGCIGSACTQSGCVGSLCIVSGCVGSGCEVSGCLGSWCITSICIESNCVGSVACKKGCNSQLFSQSELDGPKTPRVDNKDTHEAIRWWVWFGGHGPAP